MTCNVKQLRCHHTFNVKYSSLFLRIQKRNNRSRNATVIVKNKVALFMAHRVFSSRDVKMRSNTAHTSFLSQIRITASCSRCCHAAVIRDLGCYKSQKISKKYDCLMFTFYVELTACRVVSTNIRESWSEGADASVYYGPNQTLLVGDFKHSRIRKKSFSAV